MRRRELIRPIERHGCEFSREGARHTVYGNRATGQTSTVPRHRDIADLLARKICNDLGMPPPDRR
jgi:hypothetical protein